LLRRALPIGGSSREDDKHLRLWREKRGYDPKIKLTDKVAGEEPRHHGDLHGKPELDCVNRRRLPRQRWVDPELKERM
jgi:hypothetical protein